MEPIHHMGAFNAAVSSCRDHLRSFMSWPFLCQCSGCCDKDSMDEIFLLLMYNHSFHDVLESDIVKKGIAIVKSTANKNNYDSFGDRKRQTPPNTAKVTNVIKAATTRLGNMLSKIKIVLKSNS